MNSNQKFSNRWASEIQDQIGTVCTPLPIFNVNDFVKLYETLNLNKSPLLESTDSKHDSSRFSFFAVEPKYTYTQQDFDLCTLATNDSEEMPTKENIWHEIDQSLNVLKSNNNILTHLPFIGGWLGYISYEYHFEKIPKLISKKSQFPLFQFSFYNNSILFDKDTQSAQIISTNNNHVPKLILQHLNKRIEPVTKFKTIKESINPVISKSNYEEKLHQILEHIRNGDIYQANFTYKYISKFTDNPFNLYKKLRTHNPSPFASFYQINKSQFIICSSPERLFCIKNNQITACPIKGTVRRGQNIQEDNLFKNELLHSEKDSAELAMIVDLIRNDIGKISNYGSVKVQEFKKLETFESVHHLIGIITGQLKDNLSVHEIFSAMFPGGSITGAPKIRSMQILSELEETARGPYTGSLGYIDVRGNMDFNIMIRTILIDNNQLSYQVGGGIVADSTPDSEYQETLDKAKSLKTAIEDLSF